MFAIASDLYLVHLYSVELYLYLYCPCVSHFEDRTRPIIIGLCMSVPLDSNWFIMAFLITPTSTFWIKFQIPNFPSMATHQLGRRRHPILPTLQGIWWGSIFFATSPRICKFQKRSCKTKTYPTVIFLTLHWFPTNIVDFCWFHKCFPPFIEPVGLAVSSW